MRKVLLLLLFIPILYHSQKNDSILINNAFIDSALRILNLQWTWSEDVYYYQPGVNFSVQTQLKDTLKKHFSKDELFGFVRNYPDYNLKFEAFWAYAELGYNSDTIAQFFEEEIPKMNDLSYHTKYREKFMYFCPNCMLEGSTPVYYKRMMLRMLNPKEAIRWDPIEQKLVNYDLFKNCQKLDLETYLYYYSIIFSIPSSLIPYVGGVYLTWDTIPPPPPTFEVNQYLGFEVVDLNDWKEDRNLILKSCFTVKNITNKAITIRTRCHEFTKCTPISNIIPANGSYTFYFESEIDKNHKSEYITRTIYVKNPDTGQRDIFTFSAHIRGKSTK